MRSQLAVVIKMVDEVVKPLLNIKEELESTHGDFSKVQKELAKLTYQFITLHECFDKASKSVSERSADLEILEERFEEGIRALETIPEKIDESVQAGIRGATADLKKSAQREIETGIKAEVQPAVQDLNKAVKKSLDSLNAYDAMTWAMHIKLTVIAILSGLLIGLMTFYFLTRKIDNLQCNHVCVVKPAELKEMIERILPVPAPPPAVKAEPDPKPKKRQQNTQSEGYLWRK